MDTAPQDRGDGTASASVPKKSHSIRIAAAYAVVAALWILLSGKLLHRTVADPALAAHLENVKGWLFVAVTAPLLWLILDRYFAQIRRSARMLEESEKRWQYALEGAGDGVWDWDVASGRVFYSQRWKAMLGYAPHEIGDTVSEWESRLHPDDKARVMRELEPLLRGESGTYATEHRLRCKDGGYIWVLDRGTVFSRSADGRPLRVIGTHSDITQRKKAETALEESEARYRALFEAETDAVVLVDQNTDQILDGNPAAGALYGYTRDELLALKSVQLSAEPEGTLAAIAARERFVASRRHRRKDGSIFTIEAARCYFDLQGRAVHVAAFRDISERLRAENVLREAEDRLRRLGDNLPDSYIYQAVREPDGRRHFTHVSAGVERVHGFTAAQVLDDAAVLMDSIDPGQLEAYAAAEEKSARDLSDFSMELEVRHPARGACIVHVRSRPHRTDTGQVVWDGVVADVTEHRRMAAERRRWADAFENCAQGIGIGDARTNRVVACNPAFLRLIGRTAEEVVGQPVASFYAAEDHEHIRESLVACDREGRVRYEAEMLRRDGSAFPVQMDVVSVPDDHGTPLYRVATAQDISERRAALDALRLRVDLQDQLAKIADTVPGVIFSFRRQPDGTYCLPFATAAFEEMFGVKPEDLGADFGPALVHVHEDDRARAVQAIEASARTLHPWREVFRVNHPRRGERWLEGNSVPRAEPDGSVLWHGFVQDVTERKRAEAEARERARQLQLFVEHSPAAIAMLDREMRYLVASRRWLSDYRLKDECIIGRSHYEVFPEIPERWKEIHRRCLAGAVERCESDPFPRADGTVDWVRWEVRPWRTSRDEVGGLIVFSELVTERVMAERALASEATRRRILIEGSSDGIVVLDTDGAVFEANRRFAEMLGYSMDEARTLHVWDWDRNWPRPRVLAAIQALEPEGARFETRHTRKDGSSFEVELATSPGEVDGRKLVFCVCRDVSERRRAEEALRRSEQRFRTLVENAPIGVFVQIGGLFAYVNETAARLFGASQVAQLMGRPVLEFFDPSVRAQVAERIRQLNQDFRAVPPAEERCCRLDGSGFDGEFSAVPLEFDGEHGALVFFQDITGRKLLEDQLRQAQKLEGVGQLAGGIAHDFNNILAAILMHIGAMQVEAAGNQPIRAGLKELETHTQRAASLTRQLLMFSRRSVLAMTPLNVNEVAANLLKMLRRLIGETIALRFDPFDALPPVNADGGMLDQVVMNLVVNARDAMPRGGTISIATSVAELGSEDLAGNPERRAGRFVRLSVSDTGCGMSAETSKRIFEPFFTTKEPGRGTGLGLATVHGIVKQHRGWVEVESEVGRGSAFHVYLPALSRPTLVVASPGSESPAPRGNGCVLVVEDDDLLRRLTALSLQNLGYRVHQASNGQAAIGVWQQHAAEVDLLLTDMVMPEGVTGLELVERLQAAKPGLKAIIASGYSEEITRAGIPNRPGLLYLPKPYDVNGLAAAVSKLLGNTAPGPS